MGAGQAVQPTQIQVGIGSAHGKPVDPFLALSISRTTLLGCRTAPQHGNRTGMVMVDRSSARPKSPSHHRRRIQGLGFALLTLAALITVMPILIVVGYVAWQGLPAINLNFLIQPPQSGMREGGIMPAIVGTFWLTLGTGVVAVPLGVGAAVYLAEYAPDTRWTRTIRIAIINLAGIPSVVYGLFGLGLFVLFLRFGTSILAGSLTLAIMTLPVIISTAEEALRAVPQSFRVLSISLGGTKWQTIRRVVLPQALPGILTGIILGLERAAGETAPILFTAAAFFLPRLPTSIFDTTMALPYHLFVISTQVPGMPIHIQYGTALVLLVFVLSMNMIATIIRSRARARRQW
jgi:phosphate transport system permease protein